MSHTIRPKNVLNGRQKPCWPFRADFTPFGVLGVSRPDPSRGCPRVEPVPVFLSFSTARGSERCRLEARGSAPWLSRNVTSAHPRWRLGSCDGHRPSCPHVVWGPCGWRGHGREFDAPIVPSVAMLLDRCGDLACRGSCHPRDTLVACHHMGWEWWLVVVGVLRVMDGGGCFSLFSFVVLRLSPHRGLLLVVRGFVVVSDGGLPVMGFTSGSR